MIRVNKKNSYISGTLLVMVMYFTGQLIFFINTEKKDGYVCDIKGYTGRYGAEVFYLCFTTSKGEAVKKRIGSNLKYKAGESVPVIYKTNHPRMARLNDFRSLWVIPSLYYLVPLGFIMAFITGIFYGHRYISISIKPFKVWLSKSH